MIKRNSTIWLALAIALAFLAISYFGFNTYRNTNAVRESEQLVTHSYAVREAARELLASFLDIQRGQRGYILTGDPAYLEPYHAGLNRTRSDFDQLNELTADNADQQKRLNTIHDLYDQLKAEYAKTIELHNSFPGDEGHDKAIEIVSLGEEKRVMGEIRSLLDGVFREEGEILAEREVDAMNRNTISKSFIISGNLIALALLALAGFVAGVDRAKRDEAEKRMLSSQAELAAIFNSSQDGIVAFGDDMRVRLMNPAAATMLDCDAAGAIGRPLLEFTPKRIHKDVEESVRSFLESDELARPINDSFAIRLDGSEFPIAGSMTKSLINGQWFSAYIFKDLSDTKATKAKLHEQGLMLKHVRDAIIVCDTNDNVVSWNRGAELMYGLPAEKTIGKKAPELLFGNQLEIWDDGSKILEAKGVFSTEVRQVDKDGHDIVVEHRRSVISGDDGKPAAQLIIHFDVTGRKRDEAKERRSQRLESIGTLAGGIAHDLNNVLTPILMGGKLIHRAGDKHEKMAATIVTSAERGSKMIKKLLAFAGGEREMRERVDIREILLETEDILDHTLPKEIELSVECPDDLYVVSGDPTELSQVLMNLSINARDAMPGGGRLDIKAQNFEVDPDRAEATSALQTGPHVLITIVDTGHGIPKKIIDRIFDPFFTTKEQGQGTGLGLATSLGIIRSSHGEIAVYSEEGKGTSFSIYLPSAQLEESTGGAAKTDDDEIGKGNGELILLVDDESLILETASATLEAAGYRSKTAGSGTEAIAIYQHDHASIDLVLLDLMMPGMDGFATKDGVRSINPTARVIASSGLRRPGEAGGRLADINGFLAKPYSDEQLLRLVRRVLDDQT